MSALGGTGGRANGLPLAGGRTNGLAVGCSVIRHHMDGRQFGSKPGDIIAAVGPGIGPCCYSVGPNVVEAVEGAFPLPWDGPAPILETRGGLTYFNLWEAIRRTLLEAGIQPDHISVERVCTAHNLDTFYSHRGEAGQCGLFGAVLGIRDSPKSKVQSPK